MLFNLIDHYGNYGRKARQDWQTNQNFAEEGLIRVVDVLVDVGQRRIPVEIKSSATIAGDFLRGLDGYLALL